MNLKKVVIYCVVITAAYSAGRFSSPSKVEVKEVEKIVYRESETKDRNLNLNEQYKETILPDGTIIKERTRTKEYQTRVERDSSSETERLLEKKVETRASWSVGLVYEPSIHGFQRERYTGLIEKRLFGEVYLGLSGSSRGTVGLVIRLGF